ncbi:MAG: hypothetical protein WCX82_03405 [archaeon]|jgi:hypothetical protein
MKYNTILILILIIIFIASAVIIITNISKLKSPCNELALPGGYTCTNFKVVKILENTTCNGYRDCTDKLPIEYAMMSSCPHQAICLSNKCTVVCPSHK